MKNYSKVVHASDIYGSIATGQLSLDTLTCSSISRSPGVSHPHSYNKTDMTSSVIDIAPDSFLGRTKIAASLGMDLRSAVTVTENDKASLTLDHINKIGEKATNILDIIRTRYETTNMITSNVLKLAKSINHLRSGRWRKAANALGVEPRGKPKSKDVPSRWLELQYGWLPLLGDIYALGNNMFRLPTFRVRTTRWFNGQERYSYHPRDSNVHNVFVSQKIRATYVTTFNIKSPLVTTLDNLGVLNPSLVLWEAVPWSFVIDWLLPIGDFLSALTALEGIDITSNNYTTRSLRTWQGNSTWSLSSEKKSGNFFASQTDKSRSVESLRLVLPRFKNPLSLHHFANAMSLLVTSVRS